MEHLGQHRECFLAQSEKVRRFILLIGNYNFPTSHHATTKTQTLIPTASNTGSIAPLIPPNPPQ
jgi:hypothetical protein